MTKLGWKIISEDNLLWVSTTCAKYLRNSDLLDASFNPTTSWIWKGILNNMDIFSKGSCRTISATSSLNVWNFPWIPTLPYPNSIVNHAICISNLIDRISRTWDSNIIYQIFYHTTAENILKIHIPRFPPTKEWFWAPNSSGLFSINSTHDIAANISTSYSGPLTSGDWCCLWNLKVQHRHKHLLWHIVWNILLVRMNIFRFSASASIEDQVCPICNGFSESI